MSTTSKSPRMVLLAAYEVGKDALPPYAHRFSPKKFTQPQLFACLVLKAFWKTDYRGIAAMLDDSPDLRNAIGLTNVPHFTTLQKAARRLLVAAPASTLLTTTVRRLTGAGRIALAAVDSTGLEGRHVSSYFVRRRSKTPGKWQETTYKRYPKLAVVCDCRTHGILSTFTTRGPTPDVHQLRRTLMPAMDRVVIQRLVADAGYDSEANHVFLREELGIESIIPPEHGRPSSKLPPTRWRRVMATNFDKPTYGQRWQVETVFSMIKRNLGSALRGRSYFSQCREMMLLCLAHNIMILLYLLRAFLQSKPVPFPPRSSFVARRSSFGATVLSKQFAQCLMFLPSGEMKRGHPMRVALVDVGSIIYQHLGQCQVAICSGPV